MQPWALSLLVIPIKQAMLATAILDMAIGAALLGNWFVWLASLFGALHLVVVLITSGITDVTVRDIGLLAAAVALTIESLPLVWKNKISFLR